MFRDFEMDILAGSMGDQCRIEGRTEGRADTLLELLEAKFGLVPDQIKTLVKSASREQLKPWTISVLRASTLESVFQTTHSG